MIETLSKKKINLRDLQKVKSLLSGLGLSTVCTESLCPNISECFQKSYATFLILGNICTRFCKFCNIKKGVPDFFNRSEPQQVRKAAERLKLKYATLTSPTRDDLEDGGADFFAQTILELKKLISIKFIEVLVPDFRGKFKSVEKVLQAGPDVFGHNLETVKRLYSVREGADYWRSLWLLKTAKEINSGIKTKSALILGLGEKREEVLETMEDLARINCDYLALGQYLAPSVSSYTVKNIVSKKDFSRYKEEAYQLGFRHVEAGTYVRSSYQAERYLGGDLSSEEKRKSRTL